MTPENQLLRDVTAANVLFEAWATKQGYDLTREDGALMATYRSGNTEHAWRGYCHHELTQPAQPAEGGEAREFFAYHSDMGAEFFNGPDAEAAAKRLCDENLKLERAEAISTDEWADDRAESIRWGVVLGRAKFFENPGQEGEDSGDYKMVGYTAPPASQEQAGTHVLLEALRKLSCFGNGDQPGNSDGNRIAQRALDAWASQEQAQQTSTWTNGTRAPFEARPMTASKAAYFMERFKHEEKLLGPNEQKALDFVLAILKAQQPSGTWVNFDLRDITHNDPGDEPGWVRVGGHQPSGGEVDFAQAIVAESHGRYTLATSRAAFQAGAIYGQQLAALATPKPEPMTWQPIETAPENTGGLAVVRWVDDDGQEHIELDCTEDGCWMRWHDHAEHVKVIGGHGVSYTPPYKEWLPLSAPTAHHGITKEQA